MNIPEFRIKLINPSTGQEVQFDDNTRIVWDKKGKLYAYQYIYDTEQIELNIENYGI